MLAKVDVEAVYDTARVMVDLLGMALVAYDGFCCVEPILISVNNLH